MPSLALVPVDVGDASPGTDPRYRPQVWRGRAKRRNVLKTRVDLPDSSVFSSDFDEGTVPCHRAMSAWGHGLQEAAWSRLIRVVGVH